MFTIVMIATFLVMILSARNDLAVAAAMLTLISVTILSIGKSWLRMQAVMLVLVPYRSKLRRQMFSQLTLWSLAPALFLYNSIAAWLSRRITWRGTTYEMTSATSTRILDRDRV
jgi:hypothetical protein